MSDPTRYRYAIATVDPKATAFGGFGDSFLCARGKVVTVTFIARVVSTFFRYGEDQRIAKCPSVKFKFLRDVDDSAARALLYNKASPPIST